MNKRLFVLFFTVGLFADGERLWADIYHCDGKWTNKPCPQGGNVVLKEQVSAPSLSEPIEKPETPRPMASRAPCPAGQRFITERPEPKADWVTNSTPKGLAESQVAVEGSVEGHGKVELEIIGRGRLRDTEREKVLYSSTFSFPLSGGNQRFRTTFSVPSGWVWNVRVKNKGAFSGYCLAEKKEVSS